MLVVFLRLLNPTFPHFAGDLNYSYSEEISDQLRIPQAWGVRGAEGLGENDTFVLWGWPLTFFYSFVTTILGSYNISLMIFGYGLAIVLAIYGINKLTEYLKFSSIGKSASIILYLCNTYFILLLDGGQLPIALAYALLPLAYLKIILSFDGKLKDKLFAALLLVLVGIFDIRFVYLLSIIVALHFVFIAKLSRFKNTFVTAFTLLMVFVLLNFYWILPFVVGHQAALPLSYQNAEQLSFLNFTSLGHSMALIQPHWYKNVFGNVSQLNMWFLIIPMLVFATPIIVKRNKNIKFWLIIALLGIFLSKGSNPPVGGVYTWLFSKLPGFSFFRDSTKFFTLTGLSYSVLFGFGIDVITKRVGNKFRPIPYLAFCIYLLIIISPVWMGKMTGTFSLPAHQNEYEKVKKYLEKDSDFGRVMWVSNKTSLGFSSPIHSSLESSRMFSKRPFATGVVGSYETNNFLREAPYMGDLFDVYGISYIAYPYPDERRVELKPDNVHYYYSFLDQLTHLPWIEEKIVNEPVAVLKTKTTQDRFFVAPNAYNVIGSDKILEDLHRIENFDLSKNALLFSEVRPGIDGSLSKIVLYKKDKLDLIATKIPAKYFVYPSNSLNDSPNETGWWKRDNLSFLWVRNFLQQKYSLDNFDFDYGGGYAFSEGNNVLQINNPKINSGEILLARVLVGPKGGNISLYQDDSLVGSVETQKDLGVSQIKLTGYGEIPNHNFEYGDTNFTWVKIGELNKNNKLDVKTEGELNIVNALVSLPVDTFNDIDKEINNFEIINFENLNHTEKESLFAVKNETVPFVSYERLAPTHYKVTVSGLNQTSTLVFSESFDGLWELDGRPSIPVYENLNGFVVSKDGIYDLYFSPQKYVNIGFVVSIISLVGLLSYLLIKRKRN